MAIAFTGPKDAGKKLEDAVDGVLMFYMSLARGDGLFPEGIIRLLESGEV